MATRLVVILVLLCYSLVIGGFLEEEGEEDEDGKEVRDLVKREEVAQGMDPPVLVQNALEQEEAAVGVEPKNREEGNAERPEEMAGEKEAVIEQDGKDDKLKVNYS